MKTIKGEVFKALARTYGFFACLPFRLRKNKVSSPATISHRDWADYLSTKFNKPGTRVLEIGSRNVTDNNLRSRFSEATYIGFDFYPGENVDLVGDIHKLSSYFQQDDRFDLIFSSAVFEHLHMPWVAAVQIQKLLKIGGYVFVETHFSFSSHERPWHFFQFSEMGLRALFNDALGFDLIDSGMANPMAAYFAHDAESYLKYLPITELYCHSEILCQKRCEVDNFDWDQVSIDGVVNGSRYPAPTQR